jgi:hypothetical protein
MTEHTSKLNCSVGDLAITVNCRFPQNLGKIVRIISAIGFDEWQGFDELLFTWNVVVATEGAKLFYQMEDGIEGFDEGPVPDRYLRRLTPPQNYLMDELIDSEQLQMDLLLTEPADQTLQEELSHDE